MLFERKLTERELDHREIVLKNLLKNKHNLVKKYGKDAERVMYGIATKKAKKKIEQMNLDNIKELVRTQLEASPTSTTMDIDANKSFSGGADYGSEVSANSAENSREQGETQPLHYGLEEERAADVFNVNVFGYQTKYFKVCPAAKAFMDKVVEGGYGDMSERKNEIIKIAKLHDLLFMKELKAIKDPNYAKRIVTSGEVEFIADEIRDNSEDLGIPKADLDYIDNHVNIIFDAASRIDENLNEGHGLDQGDIDFLKTFVDGSYTNSYDEFQKLKKVLKFIIKSNILQDKTRDLSKGKVDEIGVGVVQDPAIYEAFLTIIGILGAGAGAAKTAEYLSNNADKVIDWVADNAPKYLDKVKDYISKKVKLTEEIKDFEVDDAVMELRNIVDEIEQKADEARDIVRDIFPNELSRLDAYGAFNVMYSANRYDTTLGKFVDRLEEEGYEIEDGVAYVNEGHMMPMDDLDVGHTDNEPHMLKKELARAGQMIQMLYRAVDKYDGQGEVDFPQWWQKKIIQANAMLDSAFDYIDGEEMVAKIDAVIDNMDSVEVDIDVVNEEEDIQKRLDAEKAIRQTLKDEGGAAGLKPLVKAVKKFGFNKEDLIKLLKRTVKVDKHKHGDYILTPINEKELSKSDEKALKKISKALGGSSKAHKNQADRINKIIREKLLGVDEKKLTAAEKRKKEDIIMALKKQKGGKKNLEPVDYAVATDRAKKLAEKNEK